jgi:tRNA pseudouridine55 synthase
MDGKPLYEYARTNTPLPRPIDARRANISLLQLESFTPATVVPGDGGHTYLPPKEQLTAEEREVYFRMSRLTKEAGVVEKAFGVDAEGSGKKKGPATAKDEPASESKVSQLDIPDLPAQGQQEQPIQEGAQVVPPTFTLRMTVSSGTYVRSIVHDVALAIGSAAHVVTLTRTRQGRFSLTNEDAEDPSAPAETTDVAQGGEDDGFDFGERKTGCMPWTVFERAIAERKARRDSAGAEGGAAKEEEVLDEEEAAGNEESPRAKWEPVEWERELMARFVPV